MKLILSHKKPDDFVIATGETHTVREFTEEAFRNVGMDIEWEGEGLKEVGKCGGEAVVKINPKFHRPAEVDHLIGDPGKAKKVLKWEPKLRFKDLVRLMMEYDLENQVGK
jgi:GDPmannose 4,6-dehydratase